MEGVRGKHLGVDGERAVEVKKCSRGININFRGWIFWKVELKLDGAVP